jgi:uncharacterized protein (TIGR00299 family) protein
LHIHLDAVGGIAGDMFIAALLHAFPEHAAGTIGAAQAMAPVECTLAGHKDHSLTGMRFLVQERGHQPHHHHDHAHWSDIRAKIAASSLPAPVRDHAIGIFALLAEAEARVHGIVPDDVAFHEVGAADSVADIMGAAWLIGSLGDVTWSVSPLPLGGGLVKTAHGMLPVPAPATALLMRGMMTHDDGIAGERVTPTGAAILRHLRPGQRLAGRMGRTGTGFGTRTLPGLSNCLRVTTFETDAVAASPVHRELLVVSFEVDDQSGEDLAAGIAHLRAMTGVHDVLLLQAFGKKNRPATQVQVLAAPEQAEAVIAACFTQTTTIGLRTQTVAARALPRRMAQTAVDGMPVRVKIVERPEGPTGKAEADDVAQAPSHAARTTLRRRAEDASL